MTTLSFTPNLQRHIQTPDAKITGETLKQVLEEYFCANPKVRSYVLDDQGAVRKHVAIFLNQDLITDRINLSDSVTDSDDIFVAQALSGG